MSVQSVNRAIDILSLFTAARPRLGITDMSRELGLPKPTIHGLVSTLVERGFLVRDEETRKYSLGFKIYELGTILAGGIKVNQVGAIAAQRLARRTRLITRLAVWDQDGMLVTMHLFPELRSDHFPQLGPRIPAYCSASGKAVLASLDKRDLTVYLNNVRFVRFTEHTMIRQSSLLKDLEEVREKGYSVEREEMLPGLACVGAPIFDHTNKPVAALSISGGREQFSPENIEEFAPELLKTSSEISCALGYTPGIHAYNEEYGLLRQASR